MKDVQTEKVYGTHSPVRYKKEIPDRMKRIILQKFKVGVTSYTVLEEGKIPICYEMVYIFTCKV